MNALGQAATAAWARVRLQRGHSAGGLWEIDANYPQARLAIGSAPDAGWPVTGPGVAPIHFEIFWDGASLWIADTRQVGGVQLDGRPVTEWVQVQGRAEVSFGGAAVQIETSTSQAQPMASNPGQAQQVIAPPQWDDVSLSGEATRVAAAPSEMAHDLDAESTRIAPPGGLPGRPQSVRPPPPPPPPPPGQRATAAPGEAPAFDALRPRLGGAPGGARPAAPMAAQQHPAEATRIASLPDRGPGAPAATSPARVEGPTQASIEIQPGYPSAQQAPAFGAGAAPAAAPMQQQQAPAAPGPGGFAAPPSFDDVHANSEANKGKGKQALPMRTWIMLAVTVLAAAGLILMGPAEEEAAPAAAAPGVPQPIATPGATEPGATPGTTPPAGQAGSPATPVAATGVPDPGSATGAGSADPGSADPGSAAGTGATGAADPGAADPGVAAATDPASEGGPTEDRIAADMVVNGRFAEALARYQAMAEAHPDRPVYATMVRVLRQKLGGCPQGGIGPDGRPCVATP